MTVRFLVLSLWVVLGCARSATTPDSGAADAGLRDAGGDPDTAADVPELDAGRDAGTDTGPDAGPTPSFELLGATLLQEGREVVLVLERREGGRSSRVAERRVRGELDPGEFGNRPVLRVSSDGRQVLVSMGVGSGSERWRWLDLERPEADLPIPAYRCTGNFPVFMRESVAFGCLGSSFVVDRSGEVLAESTCGVQVGSSVHDRVLLGCRGLTQFVDGRGEELSVIRDDVWAARVVGPDLVAGWTVEEGSESYLGHFVGGSLAMRGPRWPAEARAIGVDHTGRYAGVLVGEEVHIADALASGPGELVLGCRGGFLFEPEGPRGVATCDDQLHLFDAEAGTLDTLDLPAGGAPWRPAFHPDGRLLLLESLASTVPPQVYDRASGTFQVAWPGRTPTTLRWARSAPY